MRIPKHKFQPSEGSEFCRVEGCIHGEYGPNHDMRKYRIIQDSRTPGGSIQTVIESGIMSYISTDIRRNQLQVEYNEAHPEKTYWTRDLFIVQLEKENK